jgi:hypothetical protein
MGQLSRRIGRLIRSELKHSNDKSATSNFKAGAAFVAGGGAATGAFAGAGVSASIGGVGVAVGGKAFGVGMASMAAAVAVAGLGIAGLNRLLQKGIDPEKLLELAIEDMQIDCQSDHTIYQSSGHRSGSRLFHETETADD